MLRFLLIVAAALGAAAVTSETVLPIALIAIRIVSAHVTNLKLQTVLEFASRVAAAASERRQGHEATSPNNPADAKEKTNAP